MKEQQKVAVFDVDGTIFRSSLLVQLVNTLIENDAFPKDARLMRLNSKKGTLKKIMIVTKRMAKRQKKMMTTIMLKMLMLIVVKAKLKMNCRRASRDDVPICLQSVKEWLPLCWRCI